MIGVSSLGVVKVQVEAFGGLGVMACLSSIYYSNYTFYVKSITY